MASRVCAKCRADKPVEDFVRSNQRKDGLGSYCKPCDRERKQISLAKNPVAPETRRNYTSDYKKRHPDRVRLSERKQGLRQKFGMSLDDYDLMFRAHKGVCAVCGLAETAKGTGGRIKELSVDHNHATGQVRGLLCNRCNTALGLLDESIDRLRKLEEYLNHYERN